MIKVERISIGTQTLQLTDKEGSQIWVRTEEVNKLVRDLLLMKKWTKQLDDTNQT